MEFKRSFLRRVGVLSFLLLLGLVAKAFAAVEIVDYTRFVYSGEAPSASIRAVVAVAPEGVDTVEEATLTLYLEKANSGEIVYIYQKKLDVSGGVVASPVTINLDARNFYVPFEEGVYKLYGEVRGYGYVNGTLQGFVESSEPVMIYVKNRITPIDLDIVKVAPDFTTLNKLDKRTMSVYVTVKNSGTEDLYDIKVRLTVLDEYGVTVYEDTSSAFDLDAGEDRTVALTLDTRNLDTGKTYTVLITVFEPNYNEEETREYSVTLIPGTLGKLELVTTETYPLEVSAGDYVLLKFYVRNNLGTPVTVTPQIVISAWNVAKELSSVSFDAGEAKVIKAVVKVPEDAQPGYYTVVLRLRRPDLTTTTYTTKIHVVGFVPVMSAELVGEDMLKVGETGEFVLKLTSLEEELWNVRITATFDLGNTEVEESELSFGGKDETATVKVMVTPTEEGEGVLKVTVVDKETGEVLAEATKTITVSGKVEERTVWQGLSERAKTIAGIIVVILAILVAFFIIRGESEEQPGR